MKTICRAFNLGSKINSKTLSCLEKTALKILWGSLELRKVPNEEWVKYNRSKFTSLLLRNYVHR